MSEFFFANRTLMVALIMPLSFTTASVLAQTETSTQPNDSIIGATYDMLDEIVVTTERPVIQTDGATTTYNVDDDPAAKGSSVLDMLRKVPMVTVDGQDNIQLLGESDFKIYVNGREEPSLTANASTILKAMPAESVTKIEIINEPGAKYDAEGSAGIINLITIRKQKQSGYSGSLTAGLSNRQLMGSAYFLTKQRNITASLQAVHARSAFGTMHSSQYNETENFSSSTDRLMTSRMEQYIKFAYTGIDGNLSWEPNSSDLFTLGINFATVNGNIDHINESVDMKDIAGAIRWSYNRAIDGALKNTNASVNASFQHSFDDNPAHNLIFSYRFNYSRNPFDLFMTYHDMIDFYTPDLFERSLTTAYNREHTAQIDYSNPLDGEHHLIETGLKAIWRPNSSIGSTWDGADEASAVWNPDNHTDLRQNVDIYAAYASYTGRFNAFSVKGGLRYEHTRMGIDYHAGEIPDFTTYLNDLVPNAALSYNFNMATSLRLAYQMRISRPSINQVNPFRQTLGSQMVQFGNPDLRSERSNKVSLTYSSFGRTVGGSIGIECSMRNNTISEFTYIEDNIRNVTYANLGRRTRTSLNGFLTWSVLHGMRLVLNGRIDYIDLSAPSASLHNSGWSGNWSANWNYSLPRNWETSAYGGQSFRNINLQGHSDGWYYYGIAISKSLLADKSLRLSLNANSFLQSSQSFKTFTWTEDTAVRNTWTNRNWSVGLNVSWNFGKLNSQVRKTAAELDYDDTVNTGSKGGLGSTGM